MKWIGVIYEGVGDIAVPQLDGRTPLQVARCACAAELAVRGRSGLLGPVKEHAITRAEQLLALAAGVPADRAHAWLRGPVEAAGYEVDLDGVDFVYRGDFVTLDGDKLRSGSVELSREETVLLTDILNRAWVGYDAEAVVAEPGKVMVLLRGGAGSLPEGQAPHLVEGRPVDDSLPSGRGHEKVRGLFLRAREALAQESVNEVRLDLGENPANGIWLWGGGAPVRRQSDTFAGEVGGCVLTQSPLARGVAALCGMDILDMRDLWSLDEGEWPDFRIAGLIEALREKNFLMVFVSSPHPGGRYGTAAEKVRALDKLDQFVLRPLLTIVEAHRPFRLFLTTDRVVSSVTQRAEEGNVPFLLVGEGVDADAAAGWNEMEAGRGAFGRVHPKDLFGLIRE
ncbi:MAG: hypothetical protein KJ626_13425 [Verrucomicrobia bacterium]|nr:hypothetical protein [Verrucomicrobiota bacterium]